jgi:hypothetical protein
MAKRPKKYYTLCLRDDGDMVWRPEFGSYNRMDVSYEMSEYVERDYLRKNAKIIESGDTQVEIDQAVKELNNG